MQQVRVGQTLTYDDGRPNHRNSKAVVLAVFKPFFIVQFEDRADTTTIRWNDEEWMRHICFDGACPASRSHPVVPAV